MLEHARPGDRPVLGDMADKDHGSALLLGEAHQLLSRSAAGVSSPTSGITRPPPCRLCFAAKMLDTSAASWRSVFHSAQSGHCPCQREETEPHAWHTYRDFGFAMRRTLTDPVSFS